MKSFTAKIHTLGINPCVDVPAQVVGWLLSQAKQKNPPVQVKATINGGVKFETNVVKYQGTYRLYLNTQLRKAANVESGDTVTIALVYDPALRMPPMPDALKSALANNKGAKERWRLQPGSRRKDILNYLNSLKTDAALARNIEQVIEQLLQKDTRALSTLIRTETQGTKSREAND